MAIEVTFHGACGIVTGSCYEISSSQARILIDCGMFQGTKTVKELNYGPFAFTPAQINATILTHAHIDHCGLVPKLVKAGFHGSIMGTPPTADLLTCVLPDSGYIQEMEVQRLNRRNRRRGKPQVEPIYTRADAETSLKHVVQKPLNKWVDVAPGMRVRYWDAGHILGAASVELHVSDKGDADNPKALKLLFSGDVGPGRKALQGKPQGPSDIDYLFVESTYGSRVRKDRTAIQRQRILRDEILAGLKAGGIILIPAFAIERTQEILADLDALFDAKKLPVLPIFVDSPLATKTTAVFTKHLEEMLGREHTHPFMRSNIKYVEDVEDSKGLARLSSGAVIMAGSGMCDAGRIRHHLKNNLCRSGTTVILTGYQAPGTLGRLLSTGAKMVRIHGEEITVAARIRKLEDYSGHADQTGLVAWVNERLPVRQGIYLTHGEEDAREGLFEHLQKIGFEHQRIHLPSIGQTEHLTAKGPRTRRVKAPVNISEAATSDWHNEYAQTTLELRDHLDKLKTDRARRSVLRRIRKLLKP